MAKEPHTLREMLRMWAEQYDWEPFRKVKDAIGLGLGLGSALIFWVIIGLKL